MSVNFKQAIIDYWNKEDGFMNLKLFRSVIGLVGALHIFDNILNHKTYLNLVVSKTPAIPWKYVEGFWPDILFAKQGYLLLQATLFFLFLLFAFGKANKLVRGLLCVLYFVQYRIQMHGGYGAEQYVLLALLYSPFIPFTKYEIENTKHSIGLKLLKLHFSLTLIEVGILKLLQPGWRTGEYLYNALTGPWSITEVFLNYNFSSYSYVYFAAAWLTMIIQISEGVLLNTRYKSLAAAVLILFHMSISIFMGLPYFTLVIVVFALLFLDRPIKDIGRRLGFERAD